MTYRSFIAMVLVAAMAVAGLTAAPARAGDNDAKIIAGAAALAIIGMAIIDSNRDRDRDAYVVSRQRGHGHGHGHAYKPKHQAYGLPGGCRTSYYTNRGRLHGYGQQCLLNRYAGFNALPHNCAVRVRGHGVVYGRNCLRQYGYY